MQFSEQCKDHCAPTKWSPQGQDDPLRITGIVAWMDKQFLIDLPSSPRIQAQNEMNLCAVLWGAKTFKFSSVDKGGEAIHRKSTCQTIKWTHTWSLCNWLQSSLGWARFYSPCHRLHSKPSTAVSVSSHPSNDFPIVVFLFTTLQ